MSENVLPLIMVSALDAATATKLITELMDNEVTDRGMQPGEGRVWRLINKYYSVDVELRPVADGAAPPAGLERLEAHIIYVTEQGAAEVPAAEARRAGGGAAASDAAVRLVLVPGARASGALAGWARRRGYEPVPLAERAPDADAEDAPRDAVGVQRAREALHAHAWRGLRRLDRAAGRAEGAEGEGEGAVERAEAFAAALGALGEARDAPAPDDAERRRRAERLVLAFCRALGEDLPGL